MVVRAGECCANLGPPPLLISLGVLWVRHRRKVVAIGGAKADEARLASNQTMRCSNEATCRRRRAESLVSQF